MENTNIILIEEPEKEEARALTQSFARSDVKSRAYINALGAEVCKKYFEKENIISERTYNLHNIRKILEEFDISDIMLSNIHVDVRVVFDENQIFIPKSHFEYNLLPDIYVVLKLEKEHKNTEFLGFFEPKLINKNNANRDYYFIEKEKLSSPVDLKSFVENFEGSTSKEYSEEDINNAEMLMVSMADNNVTDEQKRTLLEYLLNSAELRDEFIEYENFEMLSYQAVSGVGVEIPLRTEEMDVAEISSDELSQDIVEDMIAEQATIIEDNIDSETDNSSDNITDGLVKGAAVLGAEIAGTAIVSAALAGAEEITDSAVINAAANVANITSEAIDMASSIQNMAEQVFSDENLEVPELSESLDVADDELPAVEELSMPEENAALEETAAIEENLPVDDFEENLSLEENVTPAVDETENISDNFDELFNDLNNSNDEDIFGENSDELEFQSSSNSDDLVFENSSSDSDDLVFESYGNSDDEITFSNNDDYGDYVEYGNSDDFYGGAASSSEARNQSLPQAHGVHTPISEATELMSLEDIKNGNLSPQGSAPSESAANQMETMEMDEFHSLVDSYVPTEIKNESVTVGFDSIGQAELPSQTEEPEMNTEAKVEENITHESDAFVEDMPDISNAVSNWDASLEPTSDDFVEEMPEEMDLASDLQIDNLTSDDFIEEMPSISEAISNWDTSAELTSDDFVEQMPEAIENSGLELADDLTSDDFVEDMPEEVQAETEHKEELSSDDFVEDMPEEIQTETGIAEEPSADEFAEVTDTLETSLTVEETQIPEINEVSDELTVETASEEDEPIISELNKLDSISLGEIEVPMEEEPVQMQGEEVSQEEPEIEICEEEEQPSYANSEYEDESSLGVLYTANNSTELNDIEIDRPVVAEYNFNSGKKTSKLIPFAIVAAIIIVGAIVGFFVKSKNSIDAETLIQAAPENEVLATPEADNSDILANTTEAIPDIPQDASVPASEAPAPVAAASENKTPAVNEAEKNSIAAAQTPKPLNGSKTVTVKKVSWEVPDYLSYSENIKKYLQTAGKSIKLTLSSDLLLTSEYIYSNQVKVDLKLSKDGNIQSSKVIKSSGSEEVDKIVLRTVNETLNVVKPAPGEVPTPNYNLAIIIYL